jgi:2',3'-cyclic-nucleotide 2'-phosphodiesterase (5'-nucleotidase family)
MLLSHVGFEGDKEIAKACPWLDLIVGGHSHTQLTAAEPLHNGVLITQNAMRLPQATHITLLVDSTGKVVAKGADYIDVLHYPKKNVVLEGMVDAFAQNPAFKRVLARMETPFVTTWEVGSMVCDAFRHKAGADVGLCNYRGVRVESLPAGDFTVYNALQIDPFDNAIALLTLTGEQLEQLIIDNSRMETYHFPHISGLKAVLTIDKDNPLAIKKISLRTSDGKRLDPKRTYLVATNTYLVATSKIIDPSTVRILNVQTTDAIMEYMEQQGTVSYQGDPRITLR